MLHKTGGITGFVAVLMTDGHAAALYIVGNHGFGLLICVGGVGELGRVLCRQSFALGEVEDAVIAEEGNLLLFVRLFVLFFHPLPKTTMLALSPFLK